MTEQLTLTAAISPQQKARATDPPTSKRAARLAVPRAGSQRERILQAIIDSPAGLTYDAAAEATGIVGVSVSTRISELSRDGWIEAAGERETSAGGQATIWIATAEARSLCEAGPPSPLTAGDRERRHWAEPDAPPASQSEPPTPCVLHSREGYFPKCRYCREANGLAAA